MLELTEIIKGQSSLAVIAIAVLYNLVRHAINKHYELKERREDEEIQERIVQLSADLAAARSEIEHLREKVQELQKEERG